MRPRHFARSCEVCSHDSVGTCITIEKTGLRSVKRNTGKVFQKTILHLLNDNCKPVLGDLKLESSRYFHRRGDGHAILNKLWGRSAWNSSAKGSPEQVVYMSENVYHSLVCLAREVFP